MRYGADMAFEVGKNRLEALGEVEEAADLIRYYAQTVEDNDVYDHPMDNLGDAAVHTRSILRPHGVFAVISPFNFPMALAAGPSGAALLAGNTVVYKPASAAPLSGVNLIHALGTRACRPASSTSSWVRATPSATSSSQNPGIDGIVFTGSYDVGMRAVPDVLERRARGRTIVEMGGKNPAIVSRKADLEEAAEGIMRSAFGFGGQKCSANSRVYVEKPVHDELVRLLVEKTEKLTIGDPIMRENWLGPIIDQKAVDRHQQAVAEARRDGRVFIGGEHLTDGGLERGFYVEPTVVGDLPADHRLFRDELFAPFTAVQPVDSLDEALRLANDTIYGLTAGVYSEDPARSSASSTRSRPACCTSTGAPARRPAHGRASRRSAAGRARARPARPACRCTTSPSSCGSRATPSSTSACRVLEPLCREGYGLKTAWTGANLHGLDRPRKIDRVKDGRDHRHRDPLLAILFMYVLLSLVFSGWGDPPPAGLSR